MTLVAAPLKSSIGTTIIHRKAKQGDRSIAMASSKEESHAHVEKALATSVHSGPQHGEEQQHTETFGADWTPEEEKALV